MTRLRPKGRSRSLLVRTVWLGTAYALPAQLLAAGLTRLRLHAVYKE